MRIALISVENVGFAFSKGDQVLSDINLLIPGGKISGLLGLNGIGKTTLLKLLCGLLKPQVGDIRVLNENPRDRSSSVLQNFFFVPDQCTFPAGIAGKTFVRQFSRLYPEYDAELFQRVVDSFALSLDSPLNNGSTGERKKFYIAFGFATRCRCLFFDEPLAGLDIPSKSVFRDLLVDQIDEDRVILLSTHEPRELPSLLDAVCFLSKSHAVYTELAGLDAPVAQVVTSEKVPDAIFTESHPHGFLSLIPRRVDNGHELDTEFLFRAFLNDEKRFKDAFTRPEEL